MRSRADSCIYFNKELELVTGVYVDNSIIISGKNSTIQKFKHDIKAYFEVKDLGEIRHLLSITISRNKNGSMTLDQNTYSMGPQIWHVNASDHSGFRNFPDFRFQLKMINENQKSLINCSPPLIGC